MVTSIILFNIEGPKINTVADILSEMEEISEVFSVSGNFDLVAIVRVKHNDDLAIFVTDKMVKIDGIINTDTMLAFKAYSRVDLESMFGV